METVILFVLSREKRQNKVRLTPDFAFLMGRMFCMTRKWMRIHLESAVSFLLLLFVPFSVLSPSPLVSLRLVGVFNAAIVTSQRAEEGGGARETPVPLPTMGTCFPLCGIPVSWFVCVRWLEVCDEAFVGLGSTSHPSVIFTCFSCRCYGKLKINHDRG